VGCLVPQNKLRHWPLGDATDPWAVWCHKTNCVTGPWVMQQIRGLFGATKQTVRHLSSHPFFYYIMHAHTLLAATHTDIIVNTRIINSDCVYYKNSENSMDIYQMIRIL
jgi:hypothetical protein